MGTLRFEVDIDDMGEQFWEDGKVLGKKIY